MPEILLPSHCFADKNRDYVSRSFSFFPFSSFSGQDLSPVALIAEPVVGRAAGPAVGRIVKQDVGLVARRVPEWAETVFLVEM